MRQTAAQRTLARNAERDRVDGRSDHGALLPCGYCGGHHEPGRCEDPREHAADQAAQLDIFGAEHVLAPEPPALPGTKPEYEQPRLFEPQYEGQLALAGGDNPEESGT